MAGIRNQTPVGYVTVFGLVALLAGCTNNGLPLSADQVPLEGFVPSYVQEVSNDAALATCPPYEDRQTERSDPSNDDLVAGPLRYQGLAGGYDLYQGLPATVDSDGIAYYKIGVELEPESEATVAIGGSAREYASILVENGRPEGYAEVTYRSCSDTAPDTVTWWVGGFLLRGRDSACVPLEITVAGEETKTFNIGFPTGACD